MNAKPALLSMLALIVLHQSAFAQIGVLVVRPRIPMWVVIPERYEIRAYLKNGRIVEDESAFMTSPMDEAVHIRLKRKKYYPEDTDSIIVNNFRGIPFGGRWIFSVLQGPITAYKDIPRRKAGQFKYLQKDDDIVPYRMENLRRMMRDDDEASRLLRVKSNGDLIGKGLMIAGTAAFITGLVLSDNDNGYYTDPYETRYGALPNILIAGGIGGFVAGYLTWTITLNFDIEAIHQYNGRAE